MLVRPNADVRPVPGSPPPLARGWDEIGPLCTLCAEGRLYEVEAWIENDRPIQCEPSTDRRDWKLRSPLQLAVDRGFYSLVELLLLNGYAPNGDSWSCLRPAVEAKNRPLIDLLLKHGADPQAVDFFPPIKISRPEPLRVFGLSLRRVPDGIRRPRNWSGFGAH